MKLSIYITKQEFERSTTAIRGGIRNEMNAAQLKNAIALCKFVLDPIRDHYDLPLIVRSGFRCPELNERVKGSKTSQHKFGMACDFEFASVSVEKVYTDIKAGLIKGLDGKPIKYDQLIQEFNDWVHISFAAGRNRMQNIRAVHKNRKTFYIND